MMEYLFNHNLDHILLEIFMMMDSTSLKNSTLVNRQWRDFIRREIWSSKRNRKIVRDRIWSAARYSIRLISTRKSITSLCVDDSVACCGFTDGSTSVYLIKTGEKLIDLHPGGSFNHYTSTQVEMSKDLIVTMSVGSVPPEKHQLRGQNVFQINIWERKYWTHFQSLETNQITNFCLSRKYLAIRTGSYVDIWSIEWHPCCSSVDHRHHDIELHKYLHLKINEIPYGHLSLSSHYLVGWNQKHLNWLELDPVDGHSNVVNGVVTASELFADDLDNDTSPVDNDYYSDWHSDDEDNMEQLHAHEDESDDHHLAKWKDNHCPSCNSINLATGNIKGIKTIKIMSKRLLVLTSRGELFKINAESKNINFFYRCGGTFSHLVFNPSVFGVISQSLVDIFSSNINTPMEKRKYGRVNLSDLVTCCPPLATVNSHAIIGAARGGSVLKIHDFWNNQQQEGATAS